MFKKERINNFKTLVDSYKEIDKKLVDIKVAMHDLEKLSHNEENIFCLAGLLIATIRQRPRSIRCLENVAK